MSIAAIPAYLKNHDHALASPALRFGLLLPVWKPDFSDTENDNTQAWQLACPLNTADQSLMDALGARQSALRDCLLQRDCLANFDAVSTAPFATGLGNEHPLENGFAFLHPYGLPYLPGSGVKGVLRQAARELAAGMWGETRGWTPEAITILFGAEDPSNARRGALMFHDVIPRVRASKLLVEVMTPHQQHYYQNCEAPHDSGTPVPIKFLTVPPGTGFSFLIGCNPALRKHDGLDLDSEAEWKRLLVAAFEHAFDWLGFGAKTAVGYGAMQHLSEEQIESQRRQQQADRLRCAWVDETIERLHQQHNTPQEAVLRGKLLAEAWQQLDDAPLKSNALADIRNRWKREDWWGSPPGKAAKKAKAIYAEQQ
ncbi:MAG: type III-B CRISPR module RAMP protein Cmr6 [Xanthomonadales bacterium]|nr:type III-B CRISPR module RAMP protein Cmr6 [Xanthomonadales bacterium]